MIELLVIIGIACCMGYFFLLNDVDNREIDELMGMTEEEPEEDNKKRD